MTSTPEQMQDSELQNLWLGTLKKPWKALVFVPCSAQTPVERWIQRVAQMGSRFSNQPIEVLSACGCTPEQIPGLVATLQASAARGEKVLLAVDPLWENPNSLPVAMAADAAILCVALGQSEQAEAKKALKLLGPERFLGSLCLSPPTLR